MGDVPVPLFRQSRSVQGPKMGEREMSPVLRIKRTEGKAHRFGGDWTSAKLNVLAQYLTSYTTALKNKPFRKAYIDAFAGTGYRAQKQSPGEPRGFFPDLAAKEPQSLLEGSAALALRTTPPFDKYIFIEQNPKRCEQLENLKAEFPEAAEDIEIRQGDANREIQNLCEKNWRSRRAVLFLDPYGMQVEWETIEAIASTEAIDLWLLFPLGMGVNRLLKKSGNIPESWRARLDRLLGTDAWYEEFYTVKTTRTIFGNDEEHMIKASMETIGRYFNNRLKTIFAGVAKQPGVLRNSTNSALCLLCFAVGNQRGTATALRIAEHLLKDLR
jgi:three-Cys-motif partner protein